MDGTSRSRRTSRRRSRRRWRGPPRCGPTPKRSVDGDIRFSFAQLAERVDEAARAFIASGLQAGDRAAIWAPNSARWIIASLGLYAAGGVLVPINSRFKAPEAAHVLNTSKARYLFTVTDFLDTDYVEALKGETLDSCRGNHRSGRTRPR